MVPLNYPFSNYFINEKGEIFRKIPETGRLRPLHGTVCDTGHIKVSIVGVDGTKGKFTLARLVAEKFIPNPDNLPCISYRDGNKQNTAASNLFWDRKETNAHFNHRDSNIRIKCVDTGEVFDSIKNCSQVIGISSTYVRYAVKHSKLLGGKRYEVVE